jgi:GNAT superfamily N-acetyltransferase
MRFRPSQAHPSWITTSGDRDPDAVARLLRSLPEWFGIESSVAEYVDAARVLETYRAWPDADSQAREPAPTPVGVLLGARHFPWSAEIHLMAVERSWHRHGIGRALIAAYEADLIADGTELLQVKTLGPSHPDPGYAGTRQFYTRLGFRPLEEINGLWPENPCLIMIKVLRH